MVQLIEKVKVTQICTHCFGAQECHPCGYGKAAWGLALMCPRVCLSKRYSAMPDPGAHILHNVIMWLPNSLWLLPAHSGNKSQWNYTAGGHFFQWPVCAVPVVTDSHFFPSTAHIPLHSAHSPSHGGLVSWYPEGRFGHLVGSAASSVSQYVPSPHEIGEESIWQSSSKPHHRGQNSMTWAGRHRRCRAPGWSGSWWRPPSAGGVLAHLQGGCGCQGGWLRRGGGGRRRCALLEWPQAPWAVGGPCQAVRRAGSEWPAGAGDEQPLGFKHCWSNNLATLREAYHYSFITCFNFCFGGNLVIIIFFHTELEKASFCSNPKEGQCQRTFKLLYNCTHFTW